MIITDKVRTQQGFTLLELLIGLVAFSVILAGGYAALNGLSRASSAQRQAADQLQQLQIGLQQLQTDMQQIVVPPQGVGVVRFPDSVRGDSIGVSVLRGGWSNPLRQSRSTMQRVRYELLNDQLWRNSWLNANTTTTVPDQQQVLIENVRTVRWRYRGNSNIWQDEWPTGAGGSALRAVELRLELIDGQVITRVFLTVAV